MKKKIKTDKVKNINEYKKEKKNKYKKRKNRKVKKSNIKIWINHSLFFNNYY